MENRETSNGTQREKILKIDFNVTISVIFKTINGPNSQI